MSVLIADGSAIGILIQTDNIKNLPLMYDRVVIPKEVERELKNPDTPEKIRSWLENPSIKLEVLEAKQIDESLNVHKGEKEVISLGQELKKQSEEVRLLIDEKEPRQVAEERGFKVIGTYGVLREADKQGFINSETEIEKIERFNKENPSKEFRVSEKVKTEILDKHEQIEAKRKRAKIREVQSQDSDWRKFEISLDGKKSSLVASGLEKNENESQIRQILNGNVQDLLEKQRSGEEIKIKIPKNSELKSLTKISDESDLGKTYEFNYKGKTYEATFSGADHEKQMKSFRQKLQDMQKNQSVEMQSQQQQNNQGQSY